MVFERCTDRVNQHFPLKTTKYKILVQVRMH